MDLDKAIKERKSTRKFSHKKPDWRDLIECIDSVRFAPMAGDNFSLKFVIVSDKKKIGKIAEACQQDFLAKAHYLVVVCSNPERTINAYGKRGEIYARQQAGAAIQNFLLKIEEKNLATCWVGHFVDNQIKRELEISDEVNIEAILPIGYAFEKTKPSKTEIYEAGVFVARYSQDWRDNKNDVKISVFTGKNISKEKGMKPGLWKVGRSKTITIKKKDIAKIEK